MKYMTENSGAMKEPGKGTVVYLCTCRGEIGKHVDLESVANELRKDPRVSAVAIHDELCSREGQPREAVAAGGIKL